MRVFGPVPSRRLGRSLGINNIPHKICSYSCIYCQVGKTFNKGIKRKEHYKTDEIISEVSDKLHSLTSVNEKVNYISIIPDGEPTLDVNLGYLIDSLKIFGIRVAVFTNGSILYRDDVQNDLFKADLVSVKIDSAQEDIWKIINCPGNSLNFNRVIEGINGFSQHYRGELITETMLVKNVNVKEESLISTAALINWIEPVRAYLMIPTRPPAENWVEPPSKEVIEYAYEIFDERINNLELLTANEGNDFTYTGKLEEELLSTLAVHPMKKEAVESFITKSETGWSVLQKLLYEKKLLQIEYGGKKFYQRNFKQ